MKTLKNLIISMRPEQWTKNIIIFAGLFFGKSLTTPDAFISITQIFLIFCLVSSGSYLINDLIDKEEDRRHPEKSKRPIAAGNLSIASAVWAAVILISIGLGWSISISLKLFIIVAIFFILHLLYGLFLKHIAIMDVFAIAFAFIIRLFAGVALSHIEISSWLLLCTFLLALFLALCKRRAEMALLLHDSKHHRKSLEDYNLQFLDQLIAIMGGCTILSYSLYALSSDTIAKHGTNKLVYTIHFVVYGVFRYLYLVHMRRGGTNPEKLLLKDTPLLIDIIAYCLMVCFIVYWR